jgi:molybdopterin converting factor small subunit
MAKVRVEVVSAFAEALGIPSESEELIPEPDAGDGRSVKDLLERLAAKYRYFGDVALDRDTRELTGTVAVFHNGRALELSNGLETELSDGDTLTFVPVIAGG